MISSRVYLIFSLTIIGILFISGCVSRETSTKTPTITQPPAQELPELPEIEPTQSQIQQPQQPEQPQSQLPPPECIGRAETDQNLPESCKIWFSIQKTQQPQAIQQQAQPHQPSQQQETITVKATDSVYKTVQTKPTGWFTTGQDADIMLSGIDFNNAGGPLLFNHPGRIASDGKRLLLADRNNNRVLIWNTLPTNNTPPDIVLGQPDFTQNNPGTGLHQFNWPSSVAVANSKVVVADTENDRILIWNSFPTRNAQPADLVLDLPTIGSNFALGNNFEWPWGVWTDGTKLAVSATGGSRVLLWNTFPIQNNQLPAVVLSAQGKFGTPRSITSNGRYLIVGDHNAKVPIGPSGHIDGSATFFWKTWPTSDDQPYDFYLEGMRAGTFLPDNRLILLSSTHYPVSIWNKPPTDANDAPNLILGQTGGWRAPGYYFVAGDSSDIVYAGGRLYFSLANGNKIVVYNGMPNASGQFPEFAASVPALYNSDNFSDQPPDFAIGAQDVYTNTLKTNFFMGNPQVATDGKSLFAVSDFNANMYVWKNLPDESGAHPDFVYDLFGQTGSINFAASAIAVGQNAMVLGGRAAGDKPTIYIWKKIPLNGELPDTTFQGKVGNIELKGPNIGVAIDDKYFYLSDGPANKIYVWEGFPDSGSHPKFTLDAPFPGRIYSDGKHLISIVGVNQAPGSHTVGIWEISKLSHSSQPAILPTDPQDIGHRFNGIGSAVVKDQHLFIADTGFGRVHVWTKVADALAGEKADVVLGASDLQEINQEIGRNKLFWPASLAFDGSYLWVGEFKFSGRLLRFNVQP